MGQGGILGKVPQEMVEGIASRGKPAALGEPLNRGRLCWYFGQLCSTADDIAAPMRRNETRSLSLMSAIPVDSATAQSGRGRSPDGAQRNPGPAHRLFPDFATLHPGYDVGQRKRPTNPAIVAMLARPLPLLAFARAAPIVCPIMPASITPAARTAAPPPLPHRFP